MELFTTIKAVLFDLDGTIVEAKEWHYNALNTALWKIAKTKISRYEHVTYLNGSPTSVKLEWLLDRGRIRSDQLTEISELKQFETVLAVENYCVPDLTKIKLMQGLTDLGIRIACVSNAQLKSIEFMLKKSALYDYMEFLQGNENVKPKPNPEPYIKCCNELELPPEQCLAIEDHAKGYESSEKAGCHSVLLQYPEVNLKQIKKELEKIHA